jgi:diguanylate cyclase (GGDEF)-like protein
MASPTTTSRPFTVNPDPLWITVVSVVLTAIVTGLDAFIGARYSVLVLYAVPILLCAWFASQVSLWFIVVLCTVGWFTAQVTGADYNRSVGEAVQHAFMRGAMFALVAILVTKLRSSVRRGADLTRIDPLTGLLNRAGFLTRATRELAALRDQSAPAALVLVDIDNLRTINQNHGQPHGDLAVALTAQSILSAVEPECPVGRTSGDEFCIFVPRLSRERLEPTIGRLRQALAGVSTLAGCPVQHSVIAAYCAEPPLSLDDLLAWAEGHLGSAPSAPAQRTEVLTYTDFAAAAA